MKYIFWYLAIGIIVTVIDVLNESRKESRAFTELMRQIDESSHPGAFIFGFITSLTIFWPINVAVSLYTKLL